MKLETEVKFFVDSLEPVRKKLKRIGAKLGWKGREKDIFLDTKNDDLKKRGGTLRIRDSYAKILTYKEKAHAKENKHFKIRKEYELEIGDPKILRVIFERLGFHVWMEYTKQHREHWRYKDVLFTLDVYPFGKFVEIEAPIKKIREIAKKLDLDFARTTTKSYVTLLREFGKKK